MRHSLKQCPSVSELCQFVCSTLKQYPFVSKPCQFVCSTLKQYPSVSKTLSICLFNFCTSDTTLARQENAVCFV